VGKLADFLKEGAERYGDLSELKPAVIAPGRFNPPHRGHKLIVDKLVALGEELGAEPVVLIIDSGKTGPKNPLPGIVRRQFLSKMFPGVTMRIYKNAFEAVEQLALNEKLIPVGGVAGADRGDDYKDMVGRMFGESVAEQYQSVVLHRNPDADYDDITGISATKARQAAVDGDIVRFRAMTGLEDHDARALIELLIKGMNDGEQSIQS
jgi:nicotinamide mononucleotide adenylyltransferase